MTWIKYLCECEIWKSMETFKPLIFCIINAPRISSCDKVSSTYEELIQRWKKRILYPLRINRFYARAPFKPRASGTEAAAFICLETRSSTSFHGLFRQRVGKVNRRAPPRGRHPIKIDPFSRFRSAFTDETLRAVGNKALRAETEPVKNIKCTYIGMHKRLVGCRGKRITDP